MTQKINRFSFLLFVALAALVPGCEIIGDIFKAGLWVGIIVVVVILVLVGAIARAFRK